MTKEEVFVKYKELFDYAEIGKNLEEIVDLDTFMASPAAPSADSGLANEGDLMRHIVMINYYAKNIASIYKTIYEVNLKSLVKVIVLHQLGKVGMFVPNTDEWQVKKLGKVYTFAETNVCLRTGERSKMMCGNAGVTFTEEEYEAMSILDKNAEEYENCARFRSHLSTIVRMANDLANTIARERYKNSIK